MTNHISQDTLITTNSRLHGLDALRGFALFLGVVLHASMSFMPNADYFWLAQDQQRSSFLSLMFFGIHTFRMPLFFLLAGFFASVMLDSKHTKGFIKDRIKRIVLPLIAGWPIVFSFLVTAIIFAAWVKTNGNLPKNPPAGPSFTPNDFPLGHLWFLYVLILFYSLLLLIRYLFSILHLSIYVQRVHQRLIPMMTSTLSPVLLALPSAISLFYTNYWMQWFGIPTPDKTLYPKLAVWVGFGSIFIFGFALATYREALTKWQKTWFWHLIIAAIMMALCFIFVDIKPKLMPATHNWQKFVYAWCYAGAAWFACFGFIGLSMKIFSRESWRIRYLSDASYWVYLIHLPIVIALQATVSKVNLIPAEIKLLFICSITMLLCLTTYQLFVRYTWIGNTLNGKRHRLE